MANIIVNPDFSSGLTGWTYSEGVEAINVPIDDDDVTVTAIGVRLPGAGYIGQRFGDATLFGNHLYFNCSPLDSTGYRLQVRLDYTDGTHDTHETHSVVEFEPPLFKQENVPVDRTKQLKQFGITNMDLHEGGAIFMTFFFLDGELESGDIPDGGDGPEPRFMRKMDSRFFDIERKLDRILDHLGEKGALSKKESFVKGKKS